jgi:hypothetical protein
MVWRPRRSHLRVAVYIVAMLTLVYVGSVPRQVTVPGLIIIALVTAMAALVLLGPRWSRGSQSAGQPSSTSTEPHHSGPPPTREPS